MSTLSYSCQWRTAGVLCPLHRFLSAGSLTTHLVTHLVEEAVLGGRSRWCCHWDGCQQSFSDVGRVKGRDSLLEHLLSHDLFVSQVNNGINLASTTNNTSGGQDQHRASLSSNVAPESSSSHRARAALASQVAQPPEDLNLHLDINAQQQPSTSSNVGSKTPPSRPSRPRQPRLRKARPFPPDVIRPTNNAHPATNKRSLPHNQSPPPSHTQSLSCEWKVDEKPCSETSLENSVDVVEHVGSVHLVHKPAYYHWWRCLWGDCHSSFPNRKALIEHIAFHLSLDLYHCSYCNMHFNTKNLLKLHRQNLQLDPHCPAIPPTPPSKPPSPAVFVPAPVSHPYIPMPPQTTPLPPLSSSHLPVAFPRSYYTS